MTAPTLFDAICPTCGGATEITLAFLKAKSGLMRCRKCLAIFDGFAEDALLSPAVPSVNAPMALLAARGISPDSGSPPQPAVVEPAVHGANFASAAPVRAPRTVRFPSPLDEPAVLGDTVTRESAPHAPLPMEIKPMGINSEVQMPSGAEVVTRPEPLTTLSEPTTRIEVKKRGLVPNRDADLAAAEVHGINPRAPSLLVEQVAAEPPQGAESTPGSKDPVPAPIIEPMELSFGSIAKSGRGAEPAALMVEPCQTESEFIQASLLGPASVNLGTAPVSDLEVQRPDQAASDTLSEQFDLLFVNHGASFEAPSPVVLNEPVQRVAPPRARAPRLAPLLNNDLPGVVEVDIEASLAHEISVPASKEPLVAEHCLEESTEIVAIRSDEFQPVAEQEVALVLESRRIEPRKIAPREIGRAPEVVAQPRESRAWAWGYSGSGTTALDRARARLAPPVSWIKKEGAPRREMLPNWSGWTLLAVCVAGLAIQAARVEGDQIYSRAPWARTQLAALCQIAGCKPGLAIATEQLGLEAAQVRTDAEGRLVFTASLKNKAGYESLAPRLWLSIEGEDGKSMASRTFTSSEWLGTHSVKGSSELEAKLVFAAPSQAAAGYKAELVLESPR